MDTQPSKLMRALFPDPSWVEIGMALVYKIGVRLGDGFFLGLGLVAAAKVCGVF